MTDEIRNSTTGTSAADADAGAVAAHAPDGAPSGGMSRRDMLRRTALAGGAALWAGAAVQTVSLRPALAQQENNGTPITVRDEFCPDCLTGNIRTIEFEFKPRGEGVLENCTDPESPGTDCGESQDVEISGNLTEDDGPFTINIRQQGQDRHTEKDVESGFSFSYENDGRNSDIHITITGKNGGEQTIENLHVSCSAQLCLGDKYGSLTLLGGTLYE